MLLLVIAYLGGVLTVASPCILPILPFVFARADRPFRAHGLPMLAGMSIAFAAVATLAAVGGGWVVAANTYGRFAALSVLAVFGITLLFPAVADYFSRPWVALGDRLSRSFESDRGRSASPWPALALGVGTGLLWAPCAGPVLGLILTGAALNGASAGTSFLLLAYAGGAASSLAAALMFSGRLMNLMKATLKTGERARKFAGAAVLLAVVSIALGVDTGVLSRLSFGTTTALENAIVHRFGATRTAAPQVGSTNIDRSAVSVASSILRSELNLGVEGSLTSLSGATVWINSPPLTVEDLKGKVVLVDFWTYSCINCLRTLPYLRGWAEKYKSLGLVVIGVHAPEFAFEKRSENVQRATKDLGIDFPVAVDSDFRIWRSFDNQFWPAMYFVDAQGRVRHHQFGEGGYDKSEQVIEQLLVEAGRDVPPSGLLDVHAIGVQAPAAHDVPMSDETYLGYQRSVGFASNGSSVGDRAVDYRIPSTLRTNEWALEGTWTVERERVLLDKPDGRIAFRFQARDLHLVLGPPSGGKQVRFRVLIDGKPPGPDHGSDSDSAGNGVVDAERLYQLVRQADGKHDRLFEIVFLDPGIQAFVFTFG